VKPPCITDDLDFTQGVLFHIPRHNVSITLLNDKEAKDIREGEKKIFTSPNNIGIIHTKLPHHLLSKFLVHNVRSETPKLGVVALSEEDIVTVCAYYEYLFRSQLRE